MLILIATDDQLEVVLGESATTELPIKVSYMTIASATYTPTDFTATTNDTTAVPIVAAPSANQYRQVKFLSIVNIDNITHTVLVRKKVSGVSKVIVKTTLQVNEVLQYIDSEGFSVSKSDGSQEYKTAPNFALSAGTNSYSSGAINFSNSNNVSFGLTNNTQLTASWRAATVSFWEPPAKNLNVYSAIVNSANSTYNFSFQRLFIPYFMTVTRLDVIASIGYSATTTNGNYSASFGLYTRSASSLSLASSVTSGQSFNSNNNSSVTSGYGGVSAVRLRTFAPASWNITPGEYWLANGWSASHDGGGTNNVSVSVYGQSSLPIQGVPGGNNDVIGLNGVYSAGSGSLPNSLHLTDIVYCHSSSNSSVVSFVYRQPHFMLYGSF